MTRANRLEGSAEFKAVIDDVGLVRLCVDIARTRCLHVWQFLLGDEVMRYHDEWLSGKGREEETALFEFLVALGSRYAIGDPTCAHADTLFFEAQEQAKHFGLSATGLKATYVMVSLPKTYRYADSTKTIYWFHFLNEKGKRRMISLSAALIFDAYLYLHDKLTSLLSGTKASVQGPHDLYTEAQVIIAKLYLFYDVALSVTHNLNLATRDLIRYLSLFVHPINRSSLTSLEQDVSRDLQGEV